MKHISNFAKYLVAVLTVAIISANNSMAVSGGVQGGMNAARGSNLPDTIFGDTGVFTTVVNTLLFVVGGVAVIMIIFGGFRYIISGGKAESVTSAKNTILYAIVGIIIALLSYAILNFIVNSLTTGVDSGL